jgi:hypothetical protein
LVINQNYVKMQGQQNIKKPIITLIILLYIIFEIRFYFITAIKPLLVHCLPQSVSVITIVSLRMTFSLSNTLLFYAHKFCCLSIFEF